MKNDDLTIFSYRQGWQKFDQLTPSKYSPTMDTYSRGGQMIHPTVLPSQSPELFRGMNGLKEWRGTTWNCFGGFPAQY